MLDKKHSKVIFIISLKFIIRFVLFQFQLDVLWRFDESANVIHSKKIQPFYQNIMNLFFIFLVDQLMMKKSK